jgi:hypothetical protein
MKRKSIGFKVGVVLALLHLCLVFWAYWACVNSHSSTAGLVYIYFFFLDAPLLLIPFSVFKVFGDMLPLIEFGIFGSALWFLIPWLIDMAFHRIFPKAKTLLRVIVIIVCIPILLVGFSRLSSLGIKQNIRRERPAELKKLVNRTSSDFLTEKVVFEDKAWKTISSIRRMTCKPGDDTGLIAGISDEVVFFGENYQERHRLKIASRGINTIEPLDMDGTHSCGFLAYRYGEGVSLFDAEGKEVWKIAHLDHNTGHIDGACFGDVDGDGRQEFAVYYRYREGIHLVDGNGKTRWEHPIYSLGHVEITDLNGDGRAEIIYDNSNNANGVTEFTTLDAAGTAVNQVKIKTDSYEFAVIRWPGEKAEPFILLTEENKIRIVDLKGDTILNLDAPGCRSYGDVKAVTVKFKKDKPAYLAVRKRLHPDLLVLYVYDSEGKLVYQKTDVSEGANVSALAVMEVSDAGDEKLVAGRAQNRKPQILEYSAAR